MSEQQASGQAFPTMERGGGGLDLADPGMTLRDYFAAKAMQSLVGDAQLARELNAIAKKGGPSGSELMAQMAYVMADAMMKARQA